MENSNNIKAMSFLRADDVSRGHRRSFSKFTKI
jgi:hypothetical protein